MKSLREYLKESEDQYSRPVRGDNFAINIREECLLETYIVDETDDGIVLHADDKMIGLLESYGFLSDGDISQLEKDVAAAPVKPIASMEDQDVSMADAGEYDFEGDMAKDDLETIVRAARRLTGMLDDNENMPEWVQSKINKAADYVDTAADYIESNKQDYVSEDDSEPNPVARAVLNRILMQHPGVIATHGPQKVMDAVDELADYVNIGPDDEIGSSDVSAWTRDVIRMLAELPDEPLDEQGVAEAAKWRTHPDAHYHDYEHDDERYGQKRAMGDFDDTEDELRGRTFKDVEGGKLTKRGSDYRKAYIKRSLGKHPEPNLPEGVAEGSLNEGQYEMMLRNGQVKKFIAKDDADAKRIAAGHGAKSVIRLRGGVPAGKVAEGEKKPHPKTWHDVDPKLGKQVDKMSQAEKVKKGLAHPDTLKKKGVAEGDMDEAKYQGREVPLGKPMKGDVAKSKVYVRDPKTGNVKKVNFGDPNMKIKKNNPARRKSFRARHNCDNPGPRTKARFWSCQAW